MAKLVIDKIKKNLVIIVVSLVIIQIFLLTRIKFTAWPEMILWPYLMLKGWLPYQDIAIVHTPLMLFDLTIFYKLFGLGINQLKIYTWILILLIDYLLFYVAKATWNKKVAILALLFFIPFQLYYEGNGLWFELALSALAISTFYLLRKKEYLLAGVVFALSIFVKQTAVWFLLPITLTLLLRRSKVSFWDKGKQAFIKGVAVVLFIGVVAIWAGGILPDFYFWAVKFGIGLLPKAAGQVSFPTVRQFIAAIFPFAILAPLLKLKDKKENIIIISWSIAGFLGTFPRWGLFHLQPAIPFLAMALSLILANIKKLDTVTKILIGTYLILVSVLVARSIYRQWGQENRFYEPEVLQVANYIEKNTDQGEKIFILNAWDSVYAYSNTLPAVRPWIPHLSWYMELSGVQEAMVENLEESSPEIVVVQPFTETGLSSYKPEAVMGYILQNYEEIEKVGRYNILQKIK